jgi:peptidoglycan/LPS O-acetylase OafA/YrhL
LIPLSAEWGSKSMTERRQALHADKQAATSFFLVLVLTFFFAPPSVLAKPDAAFAAAVLVVALSAFILAFCHCHRRDFTSPRRVGRRI